MSTAIKIENVSKLYRLGTVGTGTISHDLNRWWHTIRGKEDPYAKVGQVNDRTKAATSDEKRETSSDSASPSSHSPLATDDSREAGPDYVWALKDINLEVAQGEILGIIGRNGAGKSTLLKLLSRVTAPTTGSIKTKGRIASLLEVGTGFHPELTGRENIYLNGVILGMKRHEIARQLDAIVDFSGCAKYLDTPVKRYSSGMMVRLGFAVAAHLECEILIVDEVLAVGDVDFQRKSLGKMKDISRSGKSVLFVSHNLSSVRNLCSKGVCLENGTLSKEGPTDSVLLAYGMDGSNQALEVDDAGVYGIRFTKLWLEDSGGQTIGRVVDAGQHCYLCIEYAADLNLIANFSVRIGVLDAYGTRVTQLSSDDFDIQYPANSVGTVKIEFVRFPFAAGRYHLNLNAIIANTRLHHLANAASIIVEQGNFFRAGTLGKDRQVGPVLVEHRWMEKDSLS
ncbi:UNVERIFIED_CONTAM: hypothetical protein GTU68_055022 [Idotea baltica]|nr:hypothetical protein [Idotea baltica]